MSNDFQQASRSLEGERRRKRIITDARREQNRAASRAYRKSPFDYGSVYNRGVVGTPSC